MIAIDTSALVSIILRDPEFEACVAALESATRAVISAGTLAEALIVAGRRNVAEEMAALVEELGLEVVSVTPAVARRVAGAYARWGKGVHSASLNFGDCFAYEVAQANDCPLLYVGNDFVRTDVRSAL